MDRFHVVDQLGAGAFGRALLCRDKAREFVVIKEIRCADKAARAEARREAELLRKHSHPNVCRYIASFADDQRKRFYIVLEHCDGGDLSQAIARRRSERRPYPEAQAAALFVMICLALRHVHARRIVHRDVKAANVFLTKRGIAKLGDFGVSRQLDASVALASTRVGTPYYLAPEIFEGRPYGRAADVWSLGVLFYEILALRVPFTAPSLAALCRAITSSRAPNVIGYSSACAELVASLLHKDVEKRPLTDALVKHVYVRKYMSGALEARSGRVVDDETTDDDSDDASAAIERRVASLVEPDLPAGLAAEYARCRAEALRNRIRDEGTEAPALPKQAADAQNDARRRQLADVASQQYRADAHDAARRRQLADAASHQYRENRRFRAARVREDRARVYADSGASSDEDALPDPRRHADTLADQYRENRAQARAYERRAREDLGLDGQCVDLRGAARDAVNFEKRMQEKAAKAAHQRNQRDALAEEATRYQAETRHAKQAVALDFLEPPKRHRKFRGADRKRVPSTAGGTPPSLAAPAAVASLARPTRTEQVEGALAGVFEAVARKRRDRGDVDALAEELKAALD